MQALRPASMNRTCIIVADGRSARYFSVESGDTPRHGLKLVERATLANPDHPGPGANTTGRPPTETNTNREAGPVHPIGAQRQRHRLEHERRFGCEIARLAGELTLAWKEGSVILIAEPRLLGLARGHVRDALKPALDLRELARNYTQLTASELRDQLDLGHIASARSAGI
jgi:protein required for attachment to host cells